MKADEIKKTHVFIVAPGRSVTTAKRGTAHAGGKITLADISAEKPAEVMAAYVKTGKVTVDEETSLAIEEAEVRAEERTKQIAAARVRRAEEAKKAEEEAKRPATEAQIIEAIGKLEEGNDEHWTKGGKPQVPAIETVLGKNISAAQRDEIWSKMSAGSGE